MNGIKARRFLLLQGPIGPFFANLGAALVSAGHGVTRVRFNGGDFVYDPGRHAIDFRGAQTDWNDFFSNALVHRGITDVVLFGDCRPLHQQAIESARASGCGVHVFEEGYLRPGWVTLERDGVNGYSSLPTTAEHYRRDADTFADVDGVRPILDPVSFARRAFEDVVYTLSSAALRFAYPGYRTHKPWSALTEYRSGLTRFFTRASDRRDVSDQINRLAGLSAPVFLFPLQLDSDAQIRVHSQFGTMRRAIETVVRSFASNAEPDARLAISEHPLDQAVVDLVAIARQVAEDCGVAERVICLRGGTPPTLLQNCCGLVTVNSTIGLTALEMGRPVKVLGKAVYAIPGLVHPGPLDEFWRARTSPDPELLKAFRRVLIARTQIPGGFHSPVARRCAVAAALPRLLSEIASLNTRAANEQLVLLGSEDRTCAEVQR